MNKIVIIPVSYCYPDYQNSASERFRCDWLLSPLKADKYNGTQDLSKYNVIIYQKAHNQGIIEMSRKNRNKIQIFDSTDPEWLFPERKYLKEIISNMDFITTSTEALAKGFRQFGKPVYVIPDRHKLDFYEIKKVHIDRKPILVWFGYSENFERIKPLLPIIKEYDFELIVISNELVGYGKFVKWNLDTFNKEVIKGDIVLNLLDQDGFKSNNKTTTAWAMGLPVIEKVSDLFKFLDYKEREKESIKRLKEVKEKWDIKRSCEDIIKLIKKYEVIKNENL